MDNSNPAKIQSNRQATKPVKCFLQFDIAELFKCCLMLLSAVLGVRSIPFSGLVRALCMKCDRIEFMVAHHRTGCVMFHHVADNVDRVTYLWPTVNEVTAKYGLTVRMSKDTSGFRVSQSLQQCDELVCVAVDVPNHVVDSQVLLSL